MTRTCEPNADVADVFRSALLYCRDGRSKTDGLGPENVGTRRHCRGTPRYIVLIPRRRSRRRGADVADVIEQQARHQR
jgi:hypothetical protein